MLTLDRVSYRYAGSLRPSLAEVGLELRDGEVVGLVGAGEAGKSTLCLVASGLAPRTIGGTLTGRVLIDGADTAGRPMHALATEVAIGFQNPGTQLSGVATTVYEEVAFGPMNLGIPRSEVVRRTEAALAALAIPDLAARDPGRLSGGQQQLVAMAGLLALSPRHLVLDEPTAQLDPAGTRLVSDALRRLAAGGASILVAEQKTDLLASVCDRVVALAEGRIAAQGATATLLADPRLTELGVAAPSAVRIRRLAEAAGLGQPLIERALQAGPLLMPALDLDGVVHVYRESGVRALDGVTLRIDAGERVAIVGQNGSGKSTLVRHWNGLLRPTQGRVLLDGQDMAAADGRDAGAQRWARLPGPGPPDLRRLRARRGRVRTAQPGNSRGGPASRRAGRAGVGGPRGRGAHEPVRPGIVAAQAPGPRLDPRHGHPDPGPRRADHGPGRDRRGPCPVRHRARAPGGANGRGRQP